jgi:hypothetical protein
MAAARPVVWGVVVVAAPPQQQQQQQQAIMSMCAIGCRAAADNNSKHAIAAAPM